MITLAQIYAMSREAAEKAAKEHRVPFLVWEEDLEAMPPFPFPFLGDYEPKGWKLIETYFVDCSGFGQVGEPALTAEQFLAHVKVGYGYALRETGEFQVVVGEYQKED